MKAQAPQQDTEPKPLPAELVSYGFTAYPHDVAMLYAEGKISGIVQRQAVDAIVHMTYGSPKRPQNAVITIKQFAFYCRCNDTKYLELSLASMTEHGIIGRVKKGRSWAYWLTPLGWRDAPPYDKHLVDKETAAMAVTEEPADEEAAEPVVEAVPASEPLLVLPGRNSRPFRLPPPPKETYRWENTTPYPLQFGSRIEKNSLVLFVHEAAKPGGRTKGDIPQSTHPIFPASDSKHVKRSTESDVLLKRLVNGYAKRATGKIIDDALLAKISETLNGTPLPDFERVIKSSAKRITANGFFVNLAADAAEAHAHTLAEAKAAERQKAVARVQSATKHRQFVAETLEKWPEIDPEDRRFYRERFPDDFGEQEE